MYLKIRCLKKNEISCHITSHIGINCCEIPLLVQINKNKFVVFIPGSSKTNLLKRWGVNNFHLLSKLIEKIDTKIVLIGGPDDIEECNSLVLKNKKIINLCNKINLIDLPILFENARYIIGNDTGPIHLASSTSTPLIQITGPTNPKLVKPFGKNVIALQSNINCKNCYKKNCSHHSCMSDISPDFIFKIIRKSL